MKITLKAPSRDPATWGNAVLGEINYDVGFSQFGGPIVEFNTSGGASDREVECADFEIPRGAQITALIFTGENRQRVVVRGCVEAGLALGGDLTVGVAPTPGARGAPAGYALTIVASAPAPE